MTTSIRWEPIEDLKAIREMACRTAAWGWGKLFGVGVPVDVYERDDAYLATFDVPGVRADDLEVTVCGPRLTVRGERRASEEGLACVHCGRRMGRFSRSLILHKAVEQGAVRAKLTEGVLTVTVPKRGRVEKESFEVTPEQGAEV
jgi:HSP20 family protein